MNCTRCSGTGFLNLEQLPDAILKRFEESGDQDVVLHWVHHMDFLKAKYGCSCHISPPCFSCTEYTHDVCVCDCCGDGENWYGEPGQHDNWRDPGFGGPFPECY